MQECKECVLPKVILYTTGCPQCKVVKNKLDEHGIEYETVTDEELMISKGFRSVPMLEVGDKVMTAQEVFAWLSEME